MDPASTFLWLLSALVAWVAVLIFMRFSARSKIPERANMFVARLVELFLYQDNPRDFFGSMQRFATAGALCFLSVVPPVLAATAGIVPILMMSEPFLAHSPVRKGDPFLVEVRGVIDQVDPVGVGVAATAPPVRLEHEGSLIWRMEISDNFTGTSARVSFGTAQQFMLRIAPYRGWVVHRWTRSPFVSLLPGIGKLHRDEVISGVEIDYPRRVFPIFGMRLDWISAISVFSFFFSVPFALMLTVRGREKRFG